MKKWAALRTQYEYPEKSGHHHYGKNHDLIGSKKVFGDLAVDYHEENFPGIACRTSVLIEQEESPIMPYLMGGTKSNTYPSALKLQLLCAGPLPPYCTKQQFEKLLRLSQEIWYGGKTGTDPRQGVLRPTELEALHWSTCTPSFKFSARNFGNLHCQYYWGGHHKIPRSQTCLNRLLTIQGMNAITITKNLSCVLVSKELTMPQVAVKPTVFTRVAMLSGMPT